jgi:putative two-component system hydrogenase maturation factor HypX/HoxX
MRILLLAHAFNSLTQRLFVELTEAGHQVSLEFDINDRVTGEAVALHRPELIVAPFLKRAIPEPIWRSHSCIVIHPGIKGDRGPSALDWAIMNGERDWGVTALQANGEMDAGDIWASVDFPMRDATKASLYRNEVTEAAVQALRLALERMALPGYQPEALDYARADVRGRWRAAMRQGDRAIDWGEDDTAAILRRLRAADGTPGVLDEVAGVPCYLYGAHPEGRLRGVAGTLIAQRAGAICRATVDGAVWITHAKRAGAGPALKLPAAAVLGEVLREVPESPLAPETVVDHPTWRPIRYAERGPVGFLHFPFYNGAMGTDECRQLRDAYALARLRPTRVIVLAGGPDFWSNGIDLNRIEAAADPADESWRNINAMNDLVRAIIVNDRQLTVAALCGNAGAGGAFLALAADHVWARDGVILNPHYKSMGNLYGSEYWTYLLPRRVDREQARTIVDNRLPIGARRAASLGLIDEHFAGTPPAFFARVEEEARALAEEDSFVRSMREKSRTREADEKAKALDRYRDEELERMKLNFFGFDSSYHVARYNFVFKRPRSRTPSHLAIHRALH